MESFLRRELSNDDLEDAWPESEDPAIDEVRRAVWFSYGDDSVQYGPSGEQELLARCAAFLKTAEPYVWPVPRGWQLLLGSLFGVATFGMVKLRFGATTFDAPWPFSGRPS